jgi:hypothetical protein
MSHRGLRRVEPDGTRVYQDYHRYTPVAPEDRTYKVRRPEDPRAVRWGGVWLLPLDVLEDASRTMPETRPDTDAFDHAHKPRRCTCAPCRRPEAERWRQRARS